MDNLYGKKSSGANMVAQKAFVGGRGQGYNYRFSTNAVKQLN